MSKWRNIRSKKKSLFDYGEFIGWDGEGVTINGKHRYILLMNSKGQKVINKKGLTTKQCFDFILDCVEPGEIHVCFASGYDVNKMIRNIPKDVLTELWIGEGDKLTEWNGYFLRYHKSKNFYIQRISDGKYITLYDVYSFFQSTFVNALTTYFPQEKDDEELKTIIEMKSLRSTFALEELPNIIHYCSLELKWLVLLMDCLRKHLTEQGIRVPRWDGPGAIASTLMRMYHIKEHMNQDVNNIERALRAYFGGRIETTCIGFTKQKVYQYDLRSAYPAVIQTLPSLKKGIWKKENESRLSSRYSIHRVEWKFNDCLPYYPLPYRDKNDSIKFPSCGRGWYWGCEVVAAFKYRKTYGGAIIIHESWTFISFQNEQSRVPFSFVREIYQQRKELRRRGDGAEKVNKLSLNSLYGKMHQQIGGTIEKMPPYFQPEWSGYITSQTRATLLEAALLTEYNESILMFATDAIFSLEKLPLKLGEELGEWEETVHDGILIVQPGVYYLFKGEEAKCKCRGFDLVGLQDYRRILDAWKRGVQQINIPTTRFVTLGSALASEKYWEQWGEWITTDRELCTDGYSSKRFGILDINCQMGNKKAIRQAAKELIYLLARPADGYLYLDEDSKPFHTLWNPDTEVEEAMIDNVPYNVFLHETFTEEYLG